MTSQKNAIDLLVNACNQRRLLVFCGAGVSMLPPSRAPSWWQIYSAAANALASRFEERFPDTASKLSLDELLAPLETQELADLITQRFAGPTFSNILSIVDIADPNENHRAIASLAARGCSPAIITTNFDTLIERAGASRNVYFDVVAPGISGGNIDKNCKLIKIHGTTVDTENLIETSWDKAKAVDQALIDAWQPLVGGNDLLVLGYSGADLNFGAAGRFFADFLDQGNQIFWLYRSGDKPSLPDDVPERVIFIEGSLPFPLQEILQQLCEKDFETPISHRDAQKALIKAMDEWSKSPHIGAWSAATFYWCLSEKRESNDEKTQKSLIELVMDQAQHFQVGLEVSPNDLAASILFKAVGSSLIQRNNVDDAELLLKTSVNLSTAFDNILEDTEGAEDSYSERKSNLASGWNNYGLCQLFAGKKDDALISFTKGMENAYLAGNPSGLMTSLRNILHYGLELKSVQKCMYLADTALQFADKTGDVQSSIEYRVLLACYAFDRNELWIAKDWLLEAHRRAIAVHDYKHVLITELMLAEHCIRSGCVESGLVAIAKIMEQRKHMAFISLPIEELRRYLLGLGIPQPVPFTLTLALKDVPQYVQRIKAKRKQAQSDKQIPWEGAHISISRSATNSDKDLGRLCQLGVMEFDGNSNGSIEIGLGFTQQMLQDSRHLDARWSGKNVLLQPNLNPAYKALAHALLAETEAYLGNLAAVDFHLKEAETNYDIAEERPPGRLIWVGLWYSVQTGNQEQAFYWLKKRISQIQKNRESLADLVSELHQLESWGEGMHDVAEFLRNFLSDNQIQVEKGLLTHPPYRPFSGYTKLLLGSNPDIGQHIDKALFLINQEKYREALTTLDAIAEFDEIPEQQGAVITALQVQAWGNIVPLEELEKIITYFRSKCIASLSFTTLSRLESAYLWTLMVHHENLAKVETILSRYGWVGELASDPIARGSLGAWDAMKFQLFGYQDPNSLLTNTSGLLANYFGLPEANILERLRSSFNQSSVNNNSQDLLNQVMSDMHDVFNETNSHEEANIAFTTALKTLRQSQSLSRKTFAFIVGDRANWSLNNRRFEESKALYRRSSRILFQIGDVDSALNSMAGEARSLSRAGDYQGAVTIFKEAIQKSENYPILVNLLLGLGAAHVMEASERQDKVNKTLMNKAITTYQSAITSAEIGAQERPLVKLGLARALGESDEQEKAIELFDSAIAELAHMGDPRAKLLQENREIFVNGNWRTLALS